MKPEPAKPVRSVYDLQRNDVPAAVAFVKEHMSLYGRPPHSDDMAVLLQLQDDWTELQEELAKFMPGAQGAA